MSDDELVDVISKLRTKVERLDEELDALRGQHVSLRGRVYALWGKSPPSPSAQDAAGSPESVGSDRPLTKDELRARAGIRPGKPFPHS